MNRPLLRFAPLAFAMGFAAPYAVAQDAMARLLQAGEVACEPVLPIFCSNIHVKCVGPSTTKSFPFKLRAAGTRGSIEAAPDHADVTTPYAPARVEWGEASAYVILRPQEGNGYVKMHADGSYVIRHYAPNGALMSRGECR